MNVTRPNADRLLQSIKEDQDSRARGKLKIYLGMAAGVGKTYAMLSDAIEEKERGRDVVAGYIEPHGRVETDELTAQLEQLPHKKIEIAGTIQSDFDLDAALRRKPTVLLVDELAHTNPEGARHPKRWQDIEELLAAGISVYTTVNVQHFESLRDVVAQITGVIVQETVPDSILTKAYEVELVDIPPLELIQRLKDGKVYPIERVDTALENFFTEGNLIALRELVLRRTAERVDAQMRHYRLRNAVSDIWPTRERIMVCVGPSPMAPQLVRAAHSLATSLHAELIAVNLAKASLFSESSDGQSNVSQALTIAESLGAKTIVRPADDLVEEILSIARENNVTSIVIGKPVRPRWREIISRSLVDELLGRSSGISVHVINSAISKSMPIRFAPGAAQSTFLSLFISTEVIAATTILCSLLHPSFALANISMIYVLAVALVASRYSWKEAVLSSVLAIAAFDFFFVPPRFTFAVSDAQYSVTFGVMLTISLLISTLTLRIRNQARLTSNREQRTATLYDLSRVLLSAQNGREVARAIRGSAKALFKCEVVLLFTDEALGIADTDLDSPPVFKDQNEMAVARWVLEHGTPAGIGTNTLPGSKALYLPVGGDGQTIAVLGVAFPTPPDIDQRSLLEAFVNQVTLSLERILLELQSSKSELRVEEEKLRSTLLSSISHDLRTPLAAISGAASALVEEKTLSENSRTELGKTIWDESERLTRIVRNVLDLTRLETEQIKLTKEWHSLEEIVGSAVSRSSKLLATRIVSVDIPETLPLIEVDAYLLEQLFVNLLENAGRHTPPKTNVQITGRSTDNGIEIRVSDNGAGFAKGEEELVFKKLYRGGGTSAQGFGLGLTICRAIAIAHGGTIVARNRAQGGAEFIIFLPQSSPPPTVEL